MMDVMQEFLPNWPGVLKNLEESPTQLKRKKKECVTYEQREQMLNFITENPEMITHSSTKESEQELWKDLSKQLNSLMPAKTPEFWRMFWNRWCSGLGKKPESALKVIDYRLKKYLNHIGISINEDKTEKPTIKKKLTINEINNKLSNIEAENVQLKLDIDEMDYKIIKYKNLVKELDQKLIEKKKRCKELTKLKCYLNNKKRKIDANQDLSPTMGAPTMSPM